MRGVEGEGCGVWRVSVRVWRVSLWVGKGWGEGVEGEGEGCGG